VQFITAHTRTFGKHCLHGYGDVAIYIHPHLPRRPERATHEGGAAHRAVGAAALCAKKFPAAAIFACMPPEHTRTFKKHCVFWR
jgi:hypothetical protein